MEFIGRSGSQLLFALENKAVLVDEVKNIVSEVGNLDSLVASFTLEGSQDKPASAPYELAIAATTDLDIKVFSNNDRMYTIPKSVQLEAKRSLEWHKKEKRGGTPVGLNTARTLAQGGQIGIRKIRHIAKYFPRHQVDKKAKGYKPGEKNYPSNGRIAWALWGGDAAESWASAIVARENKKAQSNSITASFNFVMSEYDSPDKIDFDSFREPNYLLEDVAPEFFVRIRLDGSGIDRLYKQEPDGSVFVWDDSMWEDLGNINNDFLTYDKTLDEPYDLVPKTHVPVDLETAIIISGLFDANPLDSVSIAKVNPEESQLLVEEMQNVDWGFVDDISITAAGEGGSATPNRDGNYTPEERSKNASGQVRDKVGKFAKSGGKVVIGDKGEYSGTIQSVNPTDQTVKVKLDNGTFVDVPGNVTQDANNFVPIEQKQNNISTKQLTQNILGEPRVPLDRPQAELPGRLPALSANQLNTVLNDWPAWVQDQRVAGQSITQQSPTSTAPKIPVDKSGNPTGSLEAPNAYNNPFLREFLEKKVVSKNGEVSYPNAVWYRPDLAGIKSNQVEGYKEKIPSKSDFLKSNPYSKALQQPAPGFSKIKASGFIAAAAALMTPETSDIPPLYMAIVSPDDPQAVMELVSLIPAGSDTTEPSTFKRKQGKWEKDDTILNDLNSPTPPPVVVLDNPTLESVLSQVDSSTKPTTASAYEIDSILASLVSAGGIDRNRGNAEELRRYWLYGKGAAKIRWKTPGDWTRCVRQLSKYMGPRAKGYCALRHHEATGMWTGDKEHRQLYGKKGIKADAFSTEFIHSSERILNQSYLKSRAADARNRVLIADAGIVDASKGADFVIPLVIPEEIESGDGRKFEKGAISMREMPLPFLWQIKTGEGHSGSVVIGVITHMERTEQGIGNARGYFDSGEYGKEAERLVRGGFIRGVSADMDMFEANEEDVASEKDSNKQVGAGKMNITKARVMAVTLVPKPAYQECKVELADGSGRNQEDDVISDGVYVEGVNPLDASALVACGIVAGMIPVSPPKEWFGDPQLKKPTALTVTDEGQVFGHIAAWHVDHIGMSYGTRPPRSKSKYSYFHTGVVRTQEGDDMPVGQLTLAGGHASLEASASEAVRHYDDTASAVADVYAGEDAYGIWVAGSLRPGTTPEQIRALRASAPSGDWRPIKGSLELVAICQVNVPGFPIARARVASGQIMALVAAGANVLAQLKHDPLAELNSRIDRLEAPLVAGANSAKARVEAVTASIKAAELSARIENFKKDSSSYMLQMLEDADTELAVISRKERKRLAEEKHALPDGSFPIRNESDLKNAVHAYGRSTPGKRGLVRRHIVKMARQLDRKDLIPSNWKEASDKTVTASITDNESIVDILTAAGGVDRNKGNAEKLRQYWTHGEGAMKIRWGQKGDWNRCVRHLAKYLGPRAKGYCQLRHKDALGMYTATHAKMDRAKHNSSYGVEEVGKPTNGFDTEVTDEHMSQPLDKIMGEHDENFDHMWNPEDEIVILIMDPQNYEDSEPPQIAEESNPFSNGGQAIVSAVSADVCPPATGSIEINLANRQKAIDTAAYGPLNPKEPNDEFWQEKATRWSVDVTEAKKSRCGNCVMFIRTPKMLDCIAAGLESGDSSKENAWDAIDTAELGYCEAFDFKCAASRTCNAWVVGGPITAAADSEKAPAAPPVQDESKVKISEEDLKGLSDEELKLLKEEFKNKQTAKDKNAKYTPKTQPRDTAGKFRLVLARLKMDLGPTGSDEAIKNIEKVENLDNAGNYGAAAKAATDLISTLGRLDTKALDPTSIVNIRTTTAQMGKVISNLPFAFGQDASKIRYSDIPPVLRDLIEGMVTKVEDKIGQKDADIATKDLKDFMSGSDYYSQSEISSQMSKLLRLLT